MNFFKPAALWESARSSYWFVPMLMVLVAMLLAIALTEFEPFFGTGLVADSGWLFASSPDGARALLGAIAGSMITVAGVTFSITISTVATTSHQFGPRLLSNFMQDRGNQVTLGTFISTFVYCLMVLRTIHDSLTLGDSEIDSFVPHLAVFVAIAMALASVVVLIYFIHHVPSSIHISSMVARVGVELSRRVDDLFPEQLGEERARRDQVDDQTLARRRAVAEPIGGDGSGYLQLIDADELFDAACRYDLQLFIDQRPGRFIHRHRPLLYAWPVSHLGEDARRDLRAAFVIGDWRNDAQDISFLIEQLIEISSRALSPGVNDPFTAIQSMDRLTEPLIELSRRQPPDTQRFDDEGRLRVIAEPFRYETLLDQVFDSLRTYLCTDVNAALYALDCLGQLYACAVTDAQRARLGQHAGWLRDACVDELSGRDLANIERRYARLRDRREI